MPCICNGANATTFKLIFVSSKAAEQIFESIPQLVINAIYISRSWKNGDSFFTLPIMSLIASAVSILFFLIRFPKTFKEVMDREAEFSKRVKMEAADYNIKPENVIKITTTTTTQS